jgi:hypothetical protein
LRIAELLIMELIKAENNNALRKAALFDAIINFFENF